MSLPQQVSVPAHITGEGMEELFAAVDEARCEYLADYKPHLDKQIAEKSKRAEEGRVKNLEKFVRQMEIVRI